jgi:hypothetical protein
MTDTERFEEAIQRLVTSVRAVLDADEACIFCPERTEMESALENYTQVVSDIYSTDEEER